MDLINLIVSFIVGYDDKKTRGMFLMIAGYSLLLTIIGIIITIFGKTTYYDIKTIILTSLIVFVIIALCLISVITSLWLSGRILGGYGKLSEVGLIYMVIIFFYSILGLLINFGNYLNDFSNSFISILGMTIVVIGFILALITIILWYISIMELQNFGFLRTIICFIIAGFITSILIKLFIFLIYPFLKLFL